MRVVSLVGCAVVAAAGYGSYLLVQRGPAEPSAAPVRSAPLGQDARTEQLAALARRVNEVAEARKLGSVPRFVLEPSAPLALIAPRPTDLDRLMLESDGWVRVQQALTRAVSGRVSNRCHAGHRGASTVDIFFHATMTERGLVASAADLTVREGSPLSAATERCLRDALAAPLEVPASSAVPPSRFEGDARTTFYFGG
jgi:hypothetical protein